MIKKLTVEQLDENPFVDFTGLLEVTSDPASVEEVYYVSNTLGAFGIRANGTPYFTTGDVPRSEQARLTLENGAYVLTRF